MSSKKYYMVPVYQMIREDLGWEDIDFILLDNIIVFKIEDGYEELDHFNNFRLLSREYSNDIKPNVLNDSLGLYLNEDDINEENRVEFFTFYEDDVVRLRCYRKLNSSFKMQYYQKNNFDDFVKDEDAKIKRLKNIKKTG